MEGVRLHGFLAALLALCLAAGCGYRLADRGGRGGEWPVFVRVLENRTAETGVETLITNHLVREFTADPRFRVTSQDRARYMLSGAVASLSQGSISQQVTGLYAERRLSAVVTLDFSGMGKTVWDRRTFTETEAYLVVPGQARATLKNRQAALEKAAARLAKKVRFELAAVLSPWGMEERESQQGPDKEKGPEDKPPAPAPAEGEKPL
ncbi:MAG: hypothetical protein JRI97_03265 [Deltaproteobacteria bacterium]|nr:hypothetical protein [Deltaproteobacteria bacterium]